MTVCHRIRKAIAEEDMVINGFTFHITASQSMAVWDGKIGVDDLMASVERSLMETKINGPNRLTSVN
jgi:GGDEF domain-containing protein